MEIRPADRILRLPAQFFTALAEKVQSYRQKGIDVISLGQGNPDLPTPAHIVEALREAVLDPATHRYPPFRGLPELKEAVCDWYWRSRGVVLDPSREVAILFGGKAGLVELGQILLNPGDLCLVPDPGYPDYASGVALAGGRIVPLRLREEHGYLPDWKSLDTGGVSRAKAMFLNYPNNPTGAVATPECFEEAVAFARKHELVIVHDYAYGAIGFDRRHPSSFLEIRGAKEVGVEVYTLSKTYNMAGWRVGFAAGNPAIIRWIEELQDHCYVSLFGAVQRAAVAALTGPQDCVEQLCATYASRRDTFVDSLRKAGWNCSLSGGTFFLWMPVPASSTSVEFADGLLEAEHVAVAPGAGFGAGGEGYVRIGLLADEERLREAATRIGRYISSRR